MTNIQANPADGEFFLKALDQFEQAAHTLLHKADQRYGLVVERQQAQDALKEAEALLTAEGIEGKNVEERKANLVVAMKNDPLAEEARATIAETDQRIASLDAEMEHTRALQGSAKSRMRYAIATRLFLASQGSQEEEA